MCTTQMQFPMTHHAFQKSALVIALLSVFGVAHAEEDEVAALITPESTISLGAGSWSGQRHQSGIYDGMRANGTYGLLDADIVQRDEKTGAWMTLRARNLGLDNREIKGEYLHQGNVSTTLEYNRISRDNPNTFTTRLQGIGTTSQTVSTNAIPGPLQTIQLGTDREITSLGFSKHLSPRLAFNVSFKNEEKTGTRQWGRGSAPEFAVEPINSTTRQIEAVLNYTTQAWQLSGGYNGSWYTNKNKMVTMTNAGLVPNATNSTYLSLPLDNQAHQLFLNGNYNFTQTTRGTFKLEYATATQNEHLPTSDVLPLAAGAPSSLNGEVRTTLAQFGVTSRPVKDLSLVANLRVHNIDDKTPIYSFVVPIAGCTPATTCVDNTPLGYKTLSGKLDATYRLSDGYSVAAGLEKRRQDRSVPVSNAYGAGGSDTQRVVPFRTQLDETTAHLAFRRALSDVLNGSMSYVNARRNGSNYQFAAGPGNGSGNGFVDISNQINPLNIADRERNKIRLALDWAPVERLSFQFNVEDGRDKYDSSAARPFGLREGTVQLYGIDASFTVSDQWKFNAWYSYDHSQAKQSAARASNAGGNAAIKDYDLEDIGNSLGLGLKGDISSRLSLGIDLELMHNLSKYQQTVTTTSGALPTFPAGFTAGLPDIENKLLKLSFFTKYALHKKAEVRFDFVHERWNTNDWSWMFANGQTPFSYGTTTDGTTVTASQNQTNNYLGARYIYKF